MNWDFVATSSILKSGTNRRLWDRSVTRTTTNRRRNYHISTHSQRVLLHLLSVGFRHQCDVTMRRRGRQDAAELGHWVRLRQHDNLVQSSGEVLAV